MAPLKADGFCSHHHHHRQHHHHQCHHQREADDLCGHRGLAAGSDHQTFSMSLPHKLRAYYDKVTFSFRVIFNDIIKDIVTDVIWFIFIAILKVVTPAAGSRGGQSRPRLTGTLLENVVAAYSTMNRSPSSSCSISLLALVTPPQICIEPDWQKVFNHMNNITSNLLTFFRSQVPHTIPRACTQGSRLWSKTSIYSYMNHGQWPSIILSEHNCTTIPQIIRQ